MDQDELDAVAEKREKLRDLRLSFKRESAELEQKYREQVREIAPVKGRRGAKPVVKI